MKSLGLTICLILMIGYPNPVQAVTDAELEALEKQIEQQEAEEVKQTEAEAKRRAEAKKQAEKKRLVELEKLRQEEQRLLEEERGKLEDEKKKLEEARLVELERKQQEEEAKRLALEEQKRKEEEAAKAKVTLVFYRSQGFFGSAAVVSIFHNATHLAKIPNQSFFIYLSPPGTQTLKAEVSFISTYEIENTFEFKPGKTYYFQVSYAINIKLQLVSEAEGRKGIKRLKNIGNINPADVLNDYDESEEAYKEPTIQQAPL